MLYGRKSLNQLAVEIISIKYTENAIYFCMDIAVELLWWAFRDDS